MDEATKKLLAELETKHGKIAHAYTGQGQLLVFRQPDLDEWEEFQELLNGGKMRRGACFRQLSQKMLVHPSVEELQRVFKEAPASSGLFADLISELAIGGVSTTVKKG